MNNMHIAIEKKIVSSLRLELSHDLEERYGSVREGFLAVDKNREGYIGLEEFIKLFDLCNFKPKMYVERVFKKCDINNNGKYPTLSLLRLFEQIIPRVKKVQ